MTKKQKDSKELVDIMSTETQEEAIRNNKLAIDEMKLRISEKKEEIETKEYSIRMSKDIFNSFDSFIQNEAQWTGKEALGIVEISKVIEDIKKNGIKGGYVYMKSLPLQASHYFLTKKRGSGFKEAKSYIDILKVFDEALQRTSEDSSSIQDMERQLAALEQGIELE